MAKVFDKGLFAIVIDGNTYHLPSGLTPFTRLQVAAQVKAFRDAAQASADATIESSLAPGRIKDDAEISDVKAESKRLNDLVHDTSAQEADAARGIIAEIIEGVPKNKSAADLVQHIVDKDALDYVGAIVGGLRYDPGAEDPSTE